MDNKTCGYKLNNSVLTVSNKSFSKSFPSVKSAEGAWISPKSRSLPYYEVRAEKEDGTEIAYQIWEELPLVRMTDDSADVLFELHGEHWTIRSVKLNAFTDEVDNLTEAVEYNLFFKGIQNTIKGDIFFLEDTLTEKAFVVISETPDHVRGELSIVRPTPKTDYPVSLKNGGYPVVIGECRKGECEAFCRRYFRQVNHCPLLVTMSNTWGDCNSANRVCDEFIRKEIEAAHEIGLDIVQIDDGWQAGNTLYRIGRDERGNRVFDDPCWDLNTQRFPEGIMPLSKLAESYGIKVGMWFAPSSHNCFANLERDKAVLRRAYEEYGARFFKLDMYQASDKKHVEKMLELLREIYSFGDDVSVQMDVTRYERLNYLCGREYGTVFVENRYTKTANSFPHRALRNLWDLSHYLPSNRFQFELVNPDLNQESYNEDDPLAPGHYDMDYLFASVMMSNPLFWMELQFLSEERRRQLSHLLDVWKTHRPALSDADIIPIGEKPCGRSHTGFCASVNGKPQYLLLFREFTDREEGSYEIPASTCEAEVLCSNTDVAVTVNDGIVKVRFGKPRAYAFIELK